MKKVLLIIIVLMLSVSVIGCSGTKRDLADQDDFLKDMASGIDARLSLTDKEKSGMTDEEKAEAYLTYVDAELKKIEKYSETYFEDELFDDLAHGYINACKMQKIAAENYKNGNLESSLWDGGRSVRCGIITELYERYGLPITSEQAESYKPTEVSYTITDENGNDISNSWLFNGDSDDVKLKEGDLEIVEANYEPSIEGYWKVNYKVKNNSQYPINMIDISLSVQDEEGNVIDFSNAFTHISVDPGKTIVCSGTIKKQNELKKVCIEKVSYDGNGNYSMHDIKMPEDAINEFVFYFD